MVKIMGSTNVGRVPVSRRTPSELALPPTANAPVEFRDEHLPECDLLKREVDCVGVGQELLAIAGQRQRSAPLQRFQILALLGPRKPNGRRFSAL
jgi:hypothetical protein